MNPAIIGSLVSCLLLLFLGTFIFSQSPGSRTNRLFSFTLWSLSYWALSEFLCRSAPDARCASGGT